MVGTNNAANYQTTQYNLITGGASNGINNVAPSATSGVPVISQGASAQPTFGTAAIAGGGTNATSFGTSQGIVVYNGTSLVNYSGPQLSSGGVYTNTTQPCFLAYNSVNISNVTGDATTYTMILDTTAYNVGSGYNTGTGVFTAPVAGKYQFTVNMYTIGITGSHSVGVGTCGGYTVWYCKPSGIATGGGTFMTSGSIIISLAASGTVSCTYYVSGGTKVAGLGGGSNLTTFCGCLLC